MSEVKTARELARLQLKYYNARDLDNFCALFHDHCKLVDYYSGDVVCDNAEDFRAIYADRFSNLELHCEVTHEIDLNNVAIDRETVSGIPGGPMEIVAIYEVEEGLIRKVTFIRQ